MELADAVEMREPPIGASHPRNGAGDHDDQQEREETGSGAGGGPHRRGRGVGSEGRKGEGWSGEWDSADGMATVLTKQRRGGWRLENGRRQRKGEGFGRRRRGFGDGNGDLVRTEEKMTRAAGRAREGTRRKVGWGRDVSQAVSAFVCLFRVFGNLFKLRVETGTEF